MVSIPRPCVELKRKLRATELDLERVRKEYATLVIKGIQTGRVAYPFAEAVREGIDPGVGWLIEQHRLDPVDKCEHCGLSAPLTLELAEPVPPLRTPMRRVCAWGCTR